MEINQIKEKDENKKEIKEVIHITKDDLYRFNLYLASLNKNLGMVVGGIVILFFGIYGIFTDDLNVLWMNILLCVMGIIGLLFAFVFYKILVKHKINKLDLQDLDDVEVTLNEDGILYKFRDEVLNEGKEFYPFAWKEISRAIVTNDYIYIHMIDRRTVILITVKYIQNEEFIVYLKDKLMPLKRYLIKDKVGKNLPTFLYLKIIFQLSCIIYYVKIKKNTKK